MKHYNDMAKCKAKDKSNRKIRKHLILDLETFNILNKSFSKLTAFSFT